MKKKKEYNYSNREKNIKGERKAEIKDTLK